MRGNTVFPQIYYPLAKLRGILSIPHSGETIPQDFDQFLVSDRRALDEDVDYHVHQLIDREQLQAQGVAIIITPIHRVCLDLNRPREMAVLNWDKNTQGISLLKAPATQEQHEIWLKAYYDPYYQKIKELIEELKKSRVGDRPPFIDLHSMPSKPTAYHLKANPRQGASRPDFCISDLKGLSCTPEFMQKILEFIQQEGHDARQNDPYFGGQVTKYVQTFGINNVQIEIKRSLYMDENKKVLLPAAPELKKKLSAALQKIFS